MADELARIAEGNNPADFHRRCPQRRTMRTSLALAPTTRAEIDALFLADPTSFVALDEAEGPTTPRKEVGHDHRAQTAPAADG